MNKKDSEEVSSSTHSENLEDHYSEQNDLNSQASKVELTTHKIQLDPLTPTNKERRSK